MAEDYRSHSSITNPGEFAHLYEKLPDSRGYRGQAFDKMGPLEKAEILTDALKARYFSNAARRKKQNLPGKGVGGQR